MKTIKYAIQEFSEKNEDFKSFTQRYEFEKKDMKL